MCVSVCPANPPYDKACTLPVVHFEERECVCVVSAGDSHEPQNPEAGVGVNRTCINACDVICRKNTQFSTLCGQCFRLKRLARDPNVCSCPSGPRNAHFREVSHANKSLAPPKGGCSSDVSGMPTHSRKQDPESIS